MYLIFVHDWDYIKKKIDRINISMNWFNSLGFLLIGAALSCLVAIVSSKQEEGGSNMILGFYLEPFLHQDVWGFGLDIQGGSRSSPNQRK